MIYDTLFAMDAKGDIKPQMIDKYSVSADDLLWTFTLRDGLHVPRRQAGHRRRRGGLDQALGAEGFARPEDEHLRQGMEGGRRQDLHRDLELADRADAAGAGQALVERALHHAQAHRRDQPERADQGIHRLGPLRLQDRRVEARRQGGVHQVRQVHAARRAAVGHGRRQDRQGRPRRVAPAFPTRRPPPTRCIAGEVDMVEDAEERPAAGGRQGPEHQDVRPEPAGQPVRAALQHHPQALRQPEGAPGDVLCAEPGGLPEGGAGRRQVLQAVQGAVHLRHAAGHRQGHGRPARVQLQEVARTAGRGQVRRHAGAC